MKLKLKAILVVSISMILLITLFLSLLRPMLLKESIELDKKNAVAETSRIKNNIHSTLKSLGKLNRDWSIWDDTYNFMMDKNPMYIGRNLGQDTFENLDINFMIYLDSQKNPKLQIGYDSENNDVLKLQDSFYKEFIPAVENEESISKELLVKSKNGFALASFESIYQSTGAGPSVGTLIIGKYIDEQTMEHIGEELFFELDIHETQNSAKKSQQIRVEEINEQQMKGSFLLIDYTEQSMIEISFKMDRNFYIQRKNIVNNIAISLVLTGIIFVFLTSFLLNRFIISRISHLSQQLNNIQVEGNVNSRIIRTKNQYDEISKLEISINQMLSSVEDKHKEVIQLALYDHLTGLPNRYAFYKEFDKRTSASTDELIVVLFDLDGFKQVNDTFGHEKGDQLLKEISRRVERITEATNGCFARYGGDEFLILFDQMNQQEIEVIVQEIVEEIGRVYSFASISTTVTASVGISVYPRDGTTIEEVLKNADYAMYEAKKRGKNQYVFFHEISGE